MRKLCMGSFVVAPLSLLFLSCLMVIKTQAAMVLGKYMQELKVWAQGEIEAATSQKARYLTGGSESSICEDDRAVHVLISRACAVRASQ